MDPHAGRENPPTVHPPNPYAMDPGEPRWTILMQGSALLTDLLELDTLEGMLVAAVVATQACPPVCCSRLNSEGRPCLLARIASRSLSPFWPRMETFESEELCLLEVTQFRHDFAFGSSTG